MLSPDAAETKIAEQAHLSREALLSLTSLLAPLLDTESNADDILLQTVLDECNGGHRSAITTSGPDPNAGAGDAHPRNDSNQTGQWDGPHSGGGISSIRREI
jgi:hypothetical protein